jgi:O-antigen chain-terminating methyltransferase
MIIAGKKFLRRIFRWYFEQIALQVESFQRGVVEALKIEKVRLCSLEKKIEGLRSEFEITLSRIELMEDRIHFLAEKIHAPLTEGAIDYLEFNRRYGGELGLLRRRYERFLVYFEGCRDVVDLGCGQGAFLELLHTHGILALGVDRDEKMVRQCRDQNLNVVKAEILSYLRVQKLGSLGGIFAAHLVEHLAPSELVTFIKLCHQALRPGAPLVLISPNGCSVFVLTQAFYRDPTHVKPVHPETLSFLVESQGFSGVSIEYYEEVPPDLRLTETNEGEESLRSALNLHIAELNRFLFGFQDYAVVAKR